MTSYLNTLRLFSREARLYLVTAGLIGFTIFGGIYTALLNLYLLRLGYGPEFIGLVNAVGLFGLAIFSLPAGMLGDRWGVRRMMILGLSLIVVGDGLLPLAEFIPAPWQKSWLLGTYGLGGLGLALYLVNTNPFLMGVSTPKERNYVFSAQAAVWPLAGFLGSLVAGFLPGMFAITLSFSLNQPAPYRYPLLLAALLLILAIWAMLASNEVRLAESTGQSTMQVQEAGAKAGPALFRVIAVLALVGLLRLVGEGTVRTFFNVYLDAALRVSTVHIGTLLAVGQLLAVPAALITPLLVARWGQGRVVILGAFGIALSLLPLALIPQWGVAGFAFMSVMALTAISRPAFTVYSQEIVPSVRRATMSGATTMAAGLSWSATALGGGYVIASLGYQSLFLLGAGFTLTGGLLFWVYFRIPRGEFARTSQLALGD